MKKNIFLLFAACIMAVLNVNAQSLKGDMNNDNKVDVSDVTAIVGLILHPVSVATPVTSITLSTKSFMTEIKSATKLTATVAPADATLPDLLWTSSDESVALVYQGYVIARYPGTATITVKAADGSGVTATCQVNVMARPIDANGHDYVDLGLPGGILWATCNVGATKPHEYGDYFAWGEITGYKNGKTIFNWNNYEWCFNNEFTLEKYCTKSDHGNGEFTDGLTTLLPIDDAATQQWGGDWRMPTNEEWNDLHNPDYCTWTWFDNTNTEFNHVPGWKVTSVANGNFIFIPIAGYYSIEGYGGKGSDGMYWSSSLFQEDPAYACYNIFNRVDHRTSTLPRYTGLSVRPVAAITVPVTDIALNESSMEITVGDEATLTATATPQYATNTSVIWTTSDASVATVADGVVTALHSGFAFITATAADGSGAAASCNVIVASMPYTYVDLGLPSGTLWATRNVGAEQDFECGEYFAWGDVRGRSGGHPDFSWSTCPFRTSGDVYNDMMFSRYLNKEGHGPVDNLTTLLPIDDAARRQWGSDWRMPTKAEWDELHNPDYCTWTWVSDYKGMAGYQVTSVANGKSIFLPLAGYCSGTTTGDQGETGWYWSSSLVDPHTASYCILSSTEHRVSYTSRFPGLSVRPVASDIITVTSISSNNASFEMSFGEETTLTIIVTPENATYPNLFWETSDASVVTVTAGGVVTAVGAGTATVTASTVDGSGLSITHTIKVTTIYDFNGHAFVDLGLPSGTIWATCNVGADAPQAFGDWFAWGDVQGYNGGHTDFNWSSCPFRTSGEDYANVKFSKYVNRNNHGAIDNKTMLEPADDAARQQWGGEWRLPSEAEWQELSNPVYCTWTWLDNTNTEYSGVQGYKVTSVINGNSIFLPAAGYRYGTGHREDGTQCHYWSLSLDKSDPFRGVYASFYWDTFWENDYIKIGVDDRMYGNSIRPVAGNQIPVAAIALSESTLSVEEGNQTTLTATVSPEDAFNPYIVWTSSNTSVATVTAGGVVTTLHPGTATITVSSTDGSGIAASCEVTVSAKPHTYVDLDLPSGTLWATCNIGADQPHQFGDFFAWGEMDGYMSDKTAFTWGTYKWANGAEKELTKYCSSIDYGDSGYTDNRRTLEPDDDTATQLWGDGWRMPTDAEWDELNSSSHCTWKWVTNNGVKGYQVTSNRNRNSIFLPAAGYYETGSHKYNGTRGLYWSSSLKTSQPSQARSILFYETSIYTPSIHELNADNRCYGLSIRPVK